MLRSDATSAVSTSLEIAIATAEDNNINSSGEAQSKQFIKTS